MTAPGGFDSDGPILVRAVWIDEATGGLRALRTEMAQTAAVGTRAGAGLGAAAAANQELGRAATRAGPGLSQARTALVLLGSQATGISPVFGRLASAFLLFGTGGAATIALLGGITAATVLLREFGRASREAAEDQEKLAEGIQKRFAALHPERALLLERAGVFTEQTRIARALAEAQAGPRTAFGFPKPESPEAAAARQQRINDLTREQGEAALVLLVIDREIAEVLKKQAVQLEEITALPPPAWFLSLRGGLRGLTIPGAEIPRGAAFLPDPRAPIREPTVGQQQIGLGRSAGAIVSDVFGLSPAQQAIQNLRREAGVFAIAMDELQSMFARGEISAEERKAAEDQLGASLEASSLAAQRLGIVAINVFAGLAQSLIAGRSAGGIFGGLLTGIGGLVSVGAKGLFAANPLLGAVLTAGGGAVSALAARGNREDPVSVRDPVVARKLDDLRDAIRDRLISITIGPETFMGTWEEIQYQLNRSGRLRGEPRIPGG
jgi:hypothetical protein